MIVKLSSTLMRESSCLLRTYFTTVKGLRSPLTYNDTHYGTSFHEFTETLARTNDLAQALTAAKEKWHSKKVIVKPRKKFLTEQHLMGVCALYHASIWESRDYDILTDDDNKPYAEVTFTVPVCIIPTEPFEWEGETHDKIEFILQGTWDLAIHIKHGTDNILDYKTTSQWDKEKYMHGYLLDPQPTGYLYSAWRLSAMYPESKFYQRFADIENIGFFIQAIFIKSNIAECDFVRSSRFTKSIKELELYHEYLVDRCHILAAAISNRKLPRGTGRFNNGCHGVYGPCSFFDYCASGDKRHRKIILSRNFVKKPFDPFNYD